MPTPAEIIAARLNRADATQNVYEEEEEEEVVTSTETTPSTNAKPSITDEAAFPTLEVRNLLPQLFLILEELHLGVP